MKGKRRAIEDAEDAMFAGEDPASPKLTKPQWEQLQRIGIRPRHNAGASVVRLNNTLVRLRLARLGDVDGLEHATITNDGRLALARRGDR